MSVNFTEVLFAVLGTTEVRVNERIGSTLPTQNLLCSGSEWHLPLIQFPD